MKLEDYKDNLIVEVKGKTYGTFKTYQLLPKGRGARMVKVLHSSSFNETEWLFAIIRTVRLVDIKVVKTNEN